MAQGVRQRTGEVLYASAVRRVMTVASVSSCTHLHGTDGAEHGTPGAIEGGWHPRHAVRNPLCSGAALLLAHVLSHGPFIPMMNGHVACHITGY